MVGNSPEIDIGGGIGPGFCTAWVRLGRYWPEDLSYQAEVTGRTGAAALRAVIGEAVERD